MEDSSGSQISMEDKIYFRFADEKDCKKLFDWRNDSEVRNNSGDSSKLIYDNHKKWFNEALNNKNVIILIILNDKFQEIGQVRLNVLQNENLNVISISLDKFFRGLGYGVSSIKKVSSLFFNNFYINDVILAKVKKENTASSQAFEKAGYTYLKEEGGFKHYVLQK